MQSIGAYAIIFIVLFIVIFGLIKKVPVFDVFVKGAKEGINTAISILPVLIALICAVSMLKASLALDALADFIRPVMDFLCIPPEVLPLMLLRPISGSASLAVCDSIFTSFSPDSYIGKITSVMMAASETSFYAIAVYFGSVGIKKTRHTVLAALSADVTGYICSILFVNLFFFT